MSAWYTATDHFVLLPAILLALFGCATLLFDFLIFPEARHRKHLMWFLAIGEVLCGAALIRQHPHLMVNRTLSKAFGLAGFRLGYLLCDPGLASYFNRVRIPWNVGLTTLAAALAGLEDREDLLRKRNTVLQGRRYMLALAGVLSPGRLSPEVRAAMTDASVLMARAEAALKACRDARGLPRRLRHRPCGHRFLPRPVCTHCGEEIRLSDLRYLEGVTRGDPVLNEGSLRRSSVAPLAADGGLMLHFVDVVADHWTPLVLAAAFMGLRRFDAIRRELGIATNILPARLGLLVAQRILVRRLYVRQPPRNEYRLTGKGLDLLHYAVVLNAWGDRWLAPPSGPAYELVHRGCGHLVAPVLRCGYCREPLRPDAVSFARARSCRFLSPSWTRPSRTQCRRRCSTSIAKPSVPARRTISSGLRCLPNHFLLTNRPKMGYISVNPQG